MRIPALLGLDFSFDFVEICGGAGSVSREMASLGLTVCTSIELSDSAAYNLEEINLVHCTLYMLQVNRFKSIMLEPPRTSFSAAAHPAARSYAMRRGLDEKNEKTRRRNLLAFRCIAIAGTAGYYSRPRWPGFLRGGSSSNAEDGEKPWWQVVLLVRHI